MTREAMIALLDQIEKEVRREYDTRHVYPLFDQLRAALSSPDLVSAVERLYFAAHWTPDRVVDAKGLWEAVRDAAGIMPGQTAARLGPAPPVAETPIHHRTDCQRARPDEPASWCQMCKDAIARRPEVYGFPASPVVAPVPVPQSEGEIVATYLGASRVAPATVVEDKHTAYVDARRDWLGVRAAVGSGPAVTAAYRRMEAARSRAAAPDMPSLLDRLETHYDFACEAGPLKNCIEWQQLRAALAPRETAPAPETVAAKLDRECVESICDHLGISKAMSRWDIAEHVEVLARAARETAPGGGR